MINYADHSGHTTHDDPYSVQKVKDDIRRWASEAQAQQSLPTRAESVRDLRDIYEGTHHEQAAIIAANADIFDKIFEQIFDKFQVKQRHELRQEGIRMVRDMAGRITALTGADIQEIKEQLSEQSMERSGARTAEQKMEWLNEQVKRKVPELMREMDGHERKFLASIDVASARKWISRESAKRWKERLADKKVTWWTKKAFLVGTFPWYLNNWKTLDKDYDACLDKAEKFGIGKRRFKELDVLLSSAYIDKEYQEKRNHVDGAFAELAAYEKNKDALYQRALVELNMAVSLGVLAKNKIGTWMRRIFESNADDRLIEDFLSGRGNMPLKKLREKWTAVKIRYNNIEGERQKGRVLTGFHFVTTDKFLSWHYTTRLAYVEEAERRLSEKPESTSSLLGDIRRELDMKDWGHAQFLIDKAKTFPLSGFEKENVASMQRYLHTQRALEPQVPSQKDLEEQDPLNWADNDMLEALAELKGISGSMYNLYIMAIEKGLDTVTALNACMYNRCWCHNHHIYDEGGELLLKEDAIETTDDKIRNGHTDWHESNRIEAGQGVGAERTYRGDVWKAQNLFVSDDEGSRRRIVNMCSANASNHAFKYWTILIPDGLNMNNHRYIVHKVAWRIKRALRANGGGGQNMKAKMPLLHQSRMAKKRQKATV